MLLLEEESIPLCWLLERDDELEAGRGRWRRAGGSGQPRLIYILGRGAQHRRVIVDDVPAGRAGRLAARQRGGAGGAAGHAALYAGLGFALARAARLWALGRRLGPSPPAGAGPRRPTLEPRNLRTAPVEPRNQNLSNPSNPRTCRTLRDCQCYTSVCFVDV